MVLYEVKDYEEMSRKAAAVIAAQVVLKPDAVLGLATGSTPLGAYEQLVKWYQRSNDTDLLQGNSLTKYLMAYLSSMLSSPTIKPSSCCRDNKILCFFRFLPLALAIKYLVREFPWSRSVSFDL